MKTIAIYILLTLSSLASVARSEPFTGKKNITCDDTSTLINALVEYGENPVWSGTDSETKTTYGILMNSKTKTWTIIQFDSKIACVLGVGEEAKSLLSGSKNVKSD